MNIAAIFSSMQIQGKVVVVTGGGNGIGRALCRAFAAAGPRAVVVTDIDQQAAQKVAGEIKGISITANVGKEAEVQRLGEQTTRQVRQVDGFCSNARGG